MFGEFRTVFAIGSIAFALSASDATAAGKLFGAWSFDEGAGAVAKDGSGNAFDGKVVGAKWVTGKYGKALDFNGDGDHVFVAFNEKQNVKKISIAVWVQPKGWNPELSAIAQKWDDNANKRQYLLTCYQQKDWWYCSGTGQSWPATGGAEVFPTNQWTHLVGTYDGKDLKTYVNGVAAGSLPMAEGIFASDTPVLIGGYGPKTPVVYGTNRHWTGLIDEVLFYDDALSLAEVKNVMNTSVAQILAVTPQGKLAAVWSRLKTP
jgi:hypothetical protein